MSAITDLTTPQFPHPRELPTGDDVRQAKSVIEQIDRNIEDLEQKIRRLRKRKRDLQQKRANYVSYISPLRRLPTEILSEIISISFKNDVDITVMAGICSRLREVVLGTPGFWTDVFLCRFNNKYAFYGSSDVSCWLIYHPWR
jgi:predicted RNase H-like nuclease (RuvC/YqgF family)